MERRLGEIAMEEYVEPVIQHQFPEWAQLQEVICDFSVDLCTQDIVRRRTHAIDLIVVAMPLREVQCHNQRPSTVLQVPIKYESLGPKPFPLLCAKT